MRLPSFFPLLLPFLVHKVLTVELAGCFESSVKFKSDLDTYWILPDVLKDPVQKLGNTADRLKKDCRVRQRFSWLVYTLRQNWLLTRAF